MKNKKHKRRKISNTPPKKEEQSVLIPDYYLPVWYWIHEEFEELLQSRGVKEPIEIRSSLVKEFAKIREDESLESQYDILLSLLKHIEEKLQSVIEKRPVFYWLHIYRRISPQLHPDIGARTDAITALEVRSYAEQAIFKYGSLSSIEGFALSTSVEFRKILGGMLNNILQKKFSPKALSVYVKRLSQKPQWVLTDFSQKDIADVYYIEGLAYQYWYVTARLRSCGKGVKIKSTSCGDLEELRTPEQQTLIASFDFRAERSSVNKGFPSNVGTFIRPGLKGIEDMIAFASLNVDHHSAQSLGLTNLPSEFAPNYLPAAFSSDEYFASHSYLAPHFEKKTGIGLLEFCQVAKICSQLLISTFHQNLDKIKDFDLLFYSKYQRGYMFYGTSLSDLKMSIIESITKQRSQELLKDSNAEQQVEIIIDFLTLDEKKQPLVNIWSLGPRFVLIKCGANYFCDYSAWHAIFRNLFFGLRNYDPDSKKGLEFEYTFGNLARQNSFNVITQSKKIRVNGLEREVDVAVRIKDDLFIFECRASERPLDYVIGKPMTISKRCCDLQSKLDQVTSLVEFIKSNKSGDNYDYSWAKNIYGSVVSPYTEWIWSLDEYYWTKIPTFPRIMSAPEAIDYLNAARIYRKLKCS